jgi:hypothetical protein
MRAHHEGPRLLRRGRLGAAAISAAIAAGSLVTAGPAAAAAPAPCDNTPQITDAALDGHHASSDVLASWVSEANGRLQAVIQVSDGSWVPAHSDATINGSAFAFVFATGGQTRYVKADASPAGVVTYDYGTYSAAGGFASAGATIGSVVYGGGGTVTIDIPGVGPGATIARPFVLTYDGIVNGTPTWVDHAPGGDLPNDPSVGADYLVGSCAGGTSLGGGTLGGTVAGAADAAGRAGAVTLSAPKALTGSGVARIAGRVVPARAGVPVRITRPGRKGVVVIATTKADGRFSALVPVRETTRLRAVAGGLGSGTVTITVRSRVRITVKRLRSGATVVRGVVTPALPGRVLWLRSDAVKASASRAVVGGRFTFRFTHAAPGRYEAVYIPTGDRAERSTSNTGVIR